ncbi:MAG: hypothetical protein COA94_07700 [Rickettsiales bacterium]|nr:MAG: hypothetical protein COA94_07700 [Rickettsiales bacterium]
MFGYNTHMTDYQAITEVTGITIIDSNIANLHVAFDAPIEWVQLSICGDFHCTGPRNYFISISESTIDESCTNDYGFDFSMTGGLVVPPNRIVDDFVSVDDCT